LLIDCRHDVIDYSKVFKKLKKINVVIDYQVDVVDYRLIFLE